MRIARSALALLFVVLALPLAAQNLEIHYIDVGWGGSVFVKGPDGTTVLLEAGNTGRGTQYVVPYLKSIGVQPANGSKRSRAPVARIRRAYVMHTPPRSADSTSRPRGVSGAMTRVDGK